MLLAFDIGNTNIVIGCIDKKKTYFTGYHMQEDLFMNAVGFDNQKNKQVITYLFDIPMENELPDYLQYDFGLTK